MKIVSANLIHSVSRNGGGLYESVRRLVQTLEQEDVGVGVFGCADENTGADVGLWSPAEVHIFKPVWPEAFGYSPGYLEEMEAYSPNLIHTHGIWLYPSMAARCYSLQTGAPTMISAHGMLDPWAVNHSRWKKVIAYLLYEQAHLENATCLRALCQSEANSIRSLGLKNPVSIIPNGIDLPEKMPEGPAPWAGRVPEGRKVLLYLGRIHPKKGLPELIRAWATISKEIGSIGNEWMLVISGWDQGGHENELKEICRQEGVSWDDLRTPESGQSAGAAVLFAGPQFNEAKARAYYNSSAFVLPSYSEGLPMVVLEAWAYHLPVLITQECNLPEGFAAGAAIQITPHAPAIVEGLRRLFEMSEAERDLMAQRGRELILHKFNWRSIAREMKEVYHWMLGGGVAPGCLMTGK